VDFMDLNAAILLKPAKIGHLERCIVALKNKSLFMGWSILCMNIPSIPQARSLLFKGMQC